MRVARSFLRRWRDAASVARWERAGRTVPPPPAFKQRLVRAYAARYELRELVETGTYLGDMISATRSTFDRVRSIELHPELCARARQRFARDSGVQILHGDSSLLLPRIVADLARPALFWLDAHWSEAQTARGAVETPIVSELQCLLRSTLGNVALVDDIRMFDGTRDYPTLAEVRDLVRTLRPDYDVVVADDVMRLTPSERRVSAR